MATFEERYAKFAAEAKKKPQKPDDILRTMQEQVDAVPKKEQPAEVPEASGVASEKADAENLRAAEARISELEQQLREGLREQNTLKTQVRRVKLVLEGANEEVARLKDENQRLTNENQRLTAENEKREQLAQTDELTGLLNRHGFNAVAPMVFNLYKGLAREVLPREGQKGREHKMDVSFNSIFIDLNGFKELNDNVSHAAGDEALKRVADALRSSVRKSDAVFRIGGDEFLILFISREDPESTRDTLAGNKLLEENRFIVAERIKRNLANTGGTATDKFGRRVQVPPLTAMIGVAQYVPVPGEGINEVVQAADAEALKLKDKKKLDKEVWEADPANAGKPYPYATEIAYAQPLEHMP
jgi:diguanylate cyclase (GGDEF)-like protein